MTNSAFLHAIVEGLYHVEVTRYAQRMPRYKSSQWAYLTMLSQLHLPLSLYMTIVRLLDLKVAIIRIG